MRLSEQNVTLAKLKSKMKPDQTEIRVFDDEVAGFGVRYRGGKKATWFIQYRFGTMQRILSLGAVGTLGADNARKAARKALAKVQLGHDPYVEKEQAQAAAELTLRAVADRFLDFKAGRLKPRSMVEVRRHLTRDWEPLGGLPIKHISKAHVAAHIKTIAKECGPVTANHARTSLSTMFTWAMREGLCDSNPVIATHRAIDEVARDRVLSDQELVDIWNACRDDDYGRIVRLLILTGQRRDEVGGLEEAELDLAGRRWIIPWARTKNGKRTRMPHEVPLSDPTIEILRDAPRRAGRSYLFGDGGRSFSGWSKAKIAIDARMTEALRKRTANPNAAMEPWRLHDIRRSCATVLADSPPDKEHPDARGLGVGVHVVESILNHISGHKAGVGGIYNRALYLPERRQALDLWGAYVLTLVNGKASNIVMLRAPA
jgi:integrase